jgi:manganese transport protein
MFWSVSPPVEGQVSSSIQQSIQQIDDVTTVEPVPAGGSARPGSGRRSSSGRVKLLGVIGPAFVAAVAFVDPGNVGTNVSAGAEYGYLLVWTVISASAVATFVQYLSAKLGLATGQSLSEVCRDNTPTPVRIGLWLVAEAVVIMTDLAEFVGGALALNLLFGLPLVTGGLVVAAITTAILGLRMRGHDVFPAVVVGLLFVVAIGFVSLALRAPFDSGAVANGLVPHFADQRSVLLAAGIVGATVMPHAVFLHSALAARFTRPSDRELGQPIIPARTRSTLRFLRRDVIIAMGLAGAVNVSMLLMATSLPADTGGSLESVHAAIAENSGTLLAAVFAVALLASGLASACAGVFSGQTIMQGFLRRNSNIWLRRAISIIPALLILAAVDPTGALVFSQVALSFGLPFALVPLVLFTSLRRVMGALVNRTPALVAGVLATVVVLGLNGVLLVQVVGV